MREMGHYFFHIVGTETEIRDEKGCRSDTIQDAADYAARIAAELAQDGDHYRGFAVLVTDRDGRVLLSVTIKPKDDAS
ncbi:DUF6894 family protein [Bradyrhizobium genosp. P]|uniref:DUF6894 family protein n=1 Tax=Bradyrhizobium genosp. P TaxID=83641 RepID=UPI003CE9133D